uniref:Conotoxin Lt9a n=1 Tax=Conus litteratus TaxID=89445 RepID=CP9A_CONLT|nr:RecName: Full=Conotoxin Lt9a; Flags: Precursor [Conus litteratus]ABC74996.1 P superfamily conotoxin lt9a variant precursor [Conus litteratus]
MTLTKSAVLILVLLLAFDNFADVQPGLITMGGGRLSNLLSKRVSIWFCASRTCSTPADCNPCTCESGVCVDWL